MGARSIILIYGARNEAKCPLHLDRKLTKKWKNLVLCVSRTPLFSENENREVLAKG